MDDFCYKVQQERNKLQEDFLRTERMLKVWQEGKADLMKMRKGLDNPDDNGLFSLNFAMSHNGLVTGQVAKSIKMICEKFNDTMELFVAPEAEGVQFVVKKGLDVADDFIEVLKSGGDWKTYLKVAVKQAPLGLLHRQKIERARSAVVMVWNFADNIKEITRMEKEHNELIEEVKTQLEHLDKTIRQYDEKIGTSARRIAMLHQAMMQADRYLMQNCYRRNMPLC